MGTLVGHVAPGFGFLLIGLWHLYNHIKLYTLHPKSYTSPPWFPSPRLRYLEPILIAVGSCISIAMELFIGPQGHQPLDDDLTIPSNHLHNFEHASISLTFLTYAIFAIILDRARRAPPDPALKHGLTQVVGAVAFGQQLLMFHLHSADHMGVEGQYHLLLQALIVVSLATTLIGIWRPRSFLVSFVRSASIAAQGVWFVVMGYALWTPGLIPKGCFMNSEEGHWVVRCRDKGSLERAKSLVNIEFSWLLVGMVVFSVAFYLVVSRRFVEEEELYVALERDEDLEAQKKLDESESFVHMGKGFDTLELER